MLSQALQIAAILTVYTNGISLTSDDYQRTAKYLNFFVIIKVSEETSTSPGAGISYPHVLWSGGTYYL
jgi:hypothetical protein